MNNNRNRIGDIKMPTIKIARIEGTEVFFFYLEISHGVWKRGQDFTYHGQPGLSPLDIFKRQLYNFRDVGNYDLHSTALTTMSKCDNTINRPLPAENEVPELLNINGWTPYGVRTTFTVLRADSIETVRELLNRHNIVVAITQSGSIIRRGKINAPLV